MELHYDRTTDCLYINLSSRPSAESEEVAEGVVVDYDAAGHIVGIDIEDASRNLSMDRINISGFTPAMECRPEA